MPMKAIKVPNHTLWMVFVFPHPSFPFRDGAGGASLPPDWVPSSWGTISWQSWPRQE